MKKIVTIIGIVLLALILAAPVMAADATYGPKVYMTDGGDRQVVASGGSVDVESGGEIDIESGAALKLSGTAITATAAEVNKLSGVTATTAEINKLASIGAGTILTSAKALVGAIAATHVFDTTADWVLSAAEKLCTLLVGDSGSGGASIVDSSGVAGTIRIIRNIGDGTFTIKESGGTGVAVAAGKTAVVMHNGTDYIRITADATH